MSPFTDDPPYFSDQELAEVKERFPRNDRIHALTARLKAAEDVAADQAIIHDPRSHEYEPDEEKCQQCRKIKRWRRSAGK